MKFTPKYRIVRDNYAGYEVQKKVWYWPFWFQVNRRGSTGANTHSTIEQAKEFIELLKQPIIYYEE